MNEALSSGRHRAAAAGQHCDSLGWASSLVDGCSRSREFARARLAGKGTHSKSRNDERRQIGGYGASVGVGRVETGELERVLDGVAVDDAAV